MVYSFLESLHVHSWDITKLVQEWLPDVQLYVFMQSKGAQQCQKVARIVAWLKFFHNERRDHGPGEHKIHNVFFCLVKNLDFQSNNSVLTLPMIPLSIVAYTT